MNGVMIVAQDEAGADSTFGSQSAATYSGTGQWPTSRISTNIPSHTMTRHSVRGMTAFVKARCNQCHVVAGHGVNLGPDLAESVKKLKGYGTVEANGGAFEQDSRKFSKLSILELLMVE